MKKRGEGIELIYEKSCGAIIYVNQDDELLFLVERMKRGHFSNCKGHVEGGENEHETARREIMEETGLEVDFVPGFRESISYSPYPDCEKEVVFFLAQAGGRETRAQESEVSEIYWLPFERAIEALSFDSDRKVLEKAFQFIKKAK